MRGRRKPDKKVSYYSLDVSDEEQVQDVMARAVHEFGPPGFLINSAGRAKPLHFEDVSFQQFDETMRINLYGCRNTIAALLPAMKKEGGHIVNVSSVAGLVGVFGYTDYCASKFAVVGFSEALKSEAARFGIGVSVLCPPDTDTPGLEQENLTKPKETKAVSANAKTMQPDEVARAMIHGVIKGKFLILPGFEAKTTWLAKRLFPRLVELVMLRSIAKVRDDS